MQDEAKKLTHKQFRFCLNYINNNYNATQAYIEAGYSETGAQQASSLLLSNIVIQEQIAELESDRMDAARITGEKVIKNIVRLGNKAEDKADITNALKAQELLGRNKLWDKGGKGGMNTVSTNPDGTVKIEFSIEKDADI